jgi:hypothetical protein
MKPAANILALVLNVLIIALRACACVWRERLVASNSMARHKNQKLLEEKS